MEIPDTIKCGIHRSWYKPEEAENSQLKTYHSDRLHQEVIRQRDELKAKLDKAKWQPIETAPKNKWLLLGYNNPLGNWRCVRGQWFDAQTIAEEWEYDGDPVQAEGFYETVENSDEIPNCFPINPTYWMLLPDAP